MHNGSASLVLASLLSLAQHTASADSPAPPPNAPSGRLLFPTDGPPAAWQVRNWTDVSQAAPPGATWLVKDDVLHGSLTRGTWLVSDREYGDFRLEYEFKLAEKGNSGFGFRFPAKGIPSYEGLELQMVDPQFFGTNYQAQPLELTGAIYKGIAPTSQTYRPLQWNSCVVTCTGSKLTVQLNGTQVIDADLATLPAPVFRGRPLANRPRRGHIGFQETSRGPGRVEIRNARILDLDPAQ